MNLSILCVTNNKYKNTFTFIREMSALSKRLNAEFVLGLDRKEAQSAWWRDLGDKVIDLKANTLQENVSDEAVRACSRDWVLRLDDDETVSPALEAWIWQTGHEVLGFKLYAFPRVYLIQDTGHYLTNEGIFPDLQTRLGKKEKMLGVNYIHAGNPNGTGQVIPYAIEHHKLLARTYKERQQIGARYEAIRAGAGSQPQYARYNLPELFYPELIITEYANHGDFSAR